MNIIFRVILSLIVALILDLSLPLCQAATMNDYCIIPAYISQNVEPNLLMIIDNSSSMFDINYADGGNIDQSTGTVTRQPYYCYDETYNSTYTYEGYFDEPYYIYDFTNKYFYSSSTFPSSSNCSKMVANTLCVGITSNRLTYLAASGNYLNWLTSSKFDIEKNILTGGKVVSKVCSGTDQSCNSNNDCVSFPGTTCTAVTTPFLEGESRGCVGQAFVKTALTSDFVNFTSTDNNVRLGITFAVRGPVDSANPSNPSRGGQTYIDVYNGTYNNQACQDAINDYFNPSVNQSTLQNAIATCINYAPSGGNQSYCYANSSVSCTTDNDCNIGTAGKCATTLTTCMSDSDCPTHLTSNGTCSNKTNSGSSISCTSDANCAAGTVSGGTCSNNSSIACTTDNQCGVRIAGTCKSKHGGVYESCTSDSGCYFWQGSNYNNYGPCQNISYYACNAMNPATSGTCSNPAPTYTSYSCNNPAPSTTYYGPCLGKTGVVNTKIALSQTIQTCWTYLSRGQAIGTGDYTRLIGGNGKCDAVYGSWGVCSGNTAYGCSSDSDCSSNSYGSCLFGPTAILPGNAAYVCSNDYLGQFCSWNSSTNKCTWNIPSPDTPVITAYQNFCIAQQPTVIDQTDSAATTINYEQLPSLLGGIGVEGQLGVPIGSIPVRTTLRTTGTCTADSDCSTNGDYTCVNGYCDKTGIIQQFQNRIRMGAMTFDFNGSYSEASSTAGAAITLPRVCDNNHTRLCSLDADCPGVPPGHCLTGDLSRQYNHDGAQVVYPIGYGFCAAMTTTPCSTDTNCSSSGGTCINGYCGTKNTTVCATDANCTSAGGTCISNGVGNHTTGLVNTLDSIRANAWTPLAEAFYNAIGYFGSRTSWMLNSGDYDTSLNPSQYRCQQNSMLLITDGSSTADQESTHVTTLASAYGTSALAPLNYTTSTKPQFWDSTCTYYAGSTYVPIFSWMAQHLNINTFDASNATTPVNARDKISTYVVGTGNNNNGQNGECNSVNLINDTATDGGTQAYFAQNAGDLKDKLKHVFDLVAAKTSSGTAASVLSNSEGSGANILQAIFYPRKEFDNQTQANWLGEINSLWYYVDPFINNSTVREDTAYTSGTKHYLYLTQDNIAKFNFDTTTASVQVTVSRDADGDSVADSPQPSGFPVTESPDALKTIWKAGKQLWARDLTISPRIIYTPCYNGGSCVSGTGLMKFSWGSPDNSSAVQSDLQYSSDNSSAVKLMKFVHGFDFPGDTTMRSRTVQIGSIPALSLSAPEFTSNPRDKGIGVWKLGDIISSTPRLQSTIRLNAYNLVYQDTTYTDFINSSDYASRAMAYAGSNDGMLHAFNLGTLKMPPVSDGSTPDTACQGGDCKARLSGTSLGEEKWAFIPRNALPYLKYLSDPNYDYSHIYAVDGSVSVNDLSINNISTCSGTYWNCPKQTAYASGTTIDTSNTSWRTVLIGSMGIGGASNVEVLPPISGVGYSSYYALDVTNPLAPTYLWEFSEKNVMDYNTANGTTYHLGYSTSGPAIVRINAQPGGTPDKSKNGRWLAIFASGPTGKIDTNAHSFKGTSSNNLTLFIVDVKTGSIVYVIDTGIQNAFAGTITKGVIDTDRWNPSKTGFYQDDVVYLGYVKQKPAPDSTWTDGGVLRLVIKENYNPDNAPDATTWVVSKLIDGIGPVTTNLTKLQDRTYHNLWIYFGTGRYFYGQDDNDGQRYIMGVKDPCYNSTTDDIDIDTDPSCMAALSLSSLKNTDNLLSTGTHGWYVPLDPEDTTNKYGAERSVTDAQALQNGSVYFTTFKPTMDVCNYGGDSFMWGVKYDTGGQIDCSALGGKALVQQSTGSFQEVDLATALGANCPLPPGESWPSGQPPIGDSRYKGGRRMAVPMTGKPPQDPPPIISKAGLVPVKKVLHVQEH